MFYTGAPKVKAMLPRRFLARDIFTLANFLSPEECDAEIAHAENLGEAPVTTMRGPVINKDWRNNERVMSDDPPRAARLWERLSPYMPSPFQKKWQPKDLNERLRYYRYDPGQLFDWHGDGYYSRSENERSFFTFMVYLNDDFEGGETLFNDERPAYSKLGLFRVKPEKGMALVFWHPVFHRGDEVTRGRKYVLRTDVMYSRPQLTYEELKAEMAADKRDWNSVLRR
jgi:hypothetical protein